MGLLELSAALLALGAGQAQEPPQTPAAQGPIVVTGEREEEDDPSPGDSAVEAPYPETERTPIGSRVARRVERRTFQSVASDSSVAGLISAPGLNFDAAGGAAERIRNRRVTQCVAGHDQVSEATACVLFRVRQHIQAGDHAAAAAAIEPLLRSGTLSGIDRFYVASFNLQLAQAMDDDVRREAALTAMLESSHMPAQDRPGAMRLLARLAAQRGDNGAAIARIERLVAEMPNDPRNHADLAWLYARTGRDGEAVSRMTAAVRLARQSGAAVPQTWLDFLNADP